MWFFLFRRRVRIADVEFPLALADDDGDNDHNHDLPRSDDNDNDNNDNQHYDHDNNYHLNNSPLTLVGSSPQMTLDKTDSCAAASVSRELNMTKIVSMTNRMKMLTMARMKMMTMVDGEQNLSAGEHSLHSVTIAAASATS